MTNHSQLVSFIWSVADLIRDSFKRGHYQDVILPFTVLRRIDCVLAEKTCCGTGGMLTIAKEHLQNLNSQAEVYLFGQEVNPQTFAVCKSDLFLISADGRDADNIAFGSTFSDDGHADRQFDYLLANPPYGKDWNLDQEVVRAEAARATKNRFGAGLPRISDGQLLFLQHMLGRMHHPGEGA